MKPSNGWTRREALGFLGAGALAAAQDAPAPGFRFEEVDDKSLKLWEGDRPVLVYNHGVLSREGVAASYNRSSYVHPLYGPDGEVLTEDFAKDHPHHRGVFWGWPHVKIGDVESQTWVPTDKILVRFVKFVRREAGAAEARLAVENAWMAGGEKAVKEEVEIVARRGDANGRIVDFDLAWTALEKPVLLRGAEGKSYGGFTLRFNTRPKEPGAIAEKQVRIAVPDGVSAKDLTDTRLPWADLTAPFPGAKDRSGAAIFIHPSHPDYPPTWLTRHYGCLCVGWPGVKGGTLESGKTARCRYRIWVHRGDPEVEALKAANAAYAGK
jgi:hypothetical protein